MSAKRNVNKTILSRQNLPVGIHQTAPLYIGESTGASVQVVWEGSPAAAIVLQSTNDPRVSSRPDDAIWFTEETTISGCDAGVADGSVVVHLDNVNTANARLQLTVTTSGIVSVFATSKN